MNFLSNNRLLQKQGKISFSWKNYFKDLRLRPITTTNYIPCFSENDYVANGWIKSDPDVIPLTQSNLDIETSPKQHDRSWTTNSTRIQTTYK